MDLSSFDQATLAGWWCDLNSFRWPSGFPAPEPLGWADMTDRQKYDSPEGKAAWAAIREAISPGDPLNEWRRRMANISAAVRDRAAAGDEPKAVPAEPREETWRDRPALL